MMTEDKLKTLNECRDLLACALGELESLEDRDDDLSITDMYWAIKDAQQLIDWYIKDSNENS